MRLSANKLALVALLCSALVPSVGAVGRTPGFFEVSANGSATYTVPIAVPSGPRGIQPAISLTYDSRYGNGVVGVGWSISGLSSIERCTRTVAQDGATDTIVMGPADRFCLNGNRLRLIGGGTTYGAPGTLYATELADYSEITAYGTAGDGPQYFIVRGKDGLIYEYGRTADSRVIPENRTSVLRWKLNKVSDRSGSTGNSYVIRYNDPDTTRYSAHAVPVAISWAPTTAGGTTYTYRMIFNYEFRDEPNDWQNGWVAGSPAYNRTRLRDITLESSASGSAVIIKKYTLGYELGPMTRRSRLSSITECADDAQTQCLNPTRFTYQAGQLSVTQGSGSTPSGITQLSGSYDFNGDGRNDLYYVTSGTWRVALSVSNGFGIPINTGVPFNAFTVVDRFTGDRDSILVNSSGTLVLYTLNAGGTAFASTSLNISRPVNTIPVAVDTDGNRFADLVWMEHTGQMMLRLNTTAGNGPVTFAPPVVAATVTGRLSDGGTYTGGTLYTQPVGPEFGLRKVDLNGDGRQDLYMDVTIVYPRSGGVRMTPLLSFGSWIHVPSNSSWTQKEQATALLFNDDRCIDRLQGSVIYVSRCQDVAATTVPIPASASPRQIADWNGDGRMDILVDNGGSVGIYRSNGTGFDPLLTSTIPIASGNQLVVLDHDGDGLDDIVRLSGSTISYYTHDSNGTLAAPGDPVAYASHIPDLLSTVEDGNAVAASIDYVSGETSLYTPAETVINSLGNYKQAGTVVGRVRHSDGIGGAYAKTYSYVAARYHTTRMSPAGFEERSEVDSRTGFIRKTQYEQLFPLVGRVKKDQLLQSDGQTIIASTDIQWLANQIPGTAQYQERYAPYVSNMNKVSREFDEVGGRNGQPMTSIAIQYRNFDAYGNYGEIESTVRDQSSGSPTYDQTWTTLATYTYTPNAATWCVGVPSRVVVSRSSTVGATVTQRTDLGVDYAKCRVANSTLQPDSATYRVATVLTYDDESGESAPDFGQVVRATITGGNLPARVRRFTWTPAGQFVRSITHVISSPAERAHEEVIEFGYDLDRGFLSSATNANGETSSFEIDPFGRVERATAPDGTSIDWTYTACGGSCISTQHVSTISQRELDSTGGVITDSMMFMDRFDRVLTTRKRMLGASYQWLEWRFDEFGRLARTSIPCLGSAQTSCASAWAQFDYDDLGRIRSISRPSSSDDPSLQSVAVSYNGRETLTADPLGSINRITRDPNGWVRRSQDANSYSVSFSYDAAGSLTGIVDSASRTLFSATYDYGLGAFQRTYFDPASVNTADYPALPNYTQTYNAFGELIGWTDPKGQTFSATYDEMSRPLTRVEPGNTTTWVWGTSASNNNMGRLEEVRSTLGGLYSERYEYDPRGRPERTTITIPNDGSYDFDYAYHGSSGLLETLTYPTSTNGCRLTLRFGYSNGFVSSVTDASNGTTCGSTGAVLWQGTQVNAFGAFTSEQLGSQLVSTHVFDPISGALDAIRTGTSSNATAIQNLGYQFDVAGNLTQRQDNNRTLTEDFSYVDTADALHRLDRSTLTANGSVLTNLRQTYDDPGAWGFGTIRTRTVTPGLDDVPLAQAIVWTSFNYPSSIVSNGQTADFSYGPERQRWRMVFNDGSITETTLYIGSLLEKVTRGNAVTYRHLIPAGSALAMLSRGSSGNVWRYLLKDHQGSLQAITDPAGSAANTLYASYSAYGNRRDASDWQGAPTQSDRDALDAITRQGYTFQTALGSMGLNHMNGRVQDALTGSFLSPDPYVTEPDYSQNFNRYSYVYNNPLTFTDPSGFNCDSGVYVNQEFEYTFPTQTISPQGGNPDRYVPPYGGTPVDINLGSTQFETGVDNPLTSSHGGPCGSTTPDYAPQYRQGTHLLRDSAVQRLLFAASQSNYTNGTVSEYRPLFKDNLAGRMMQDFDFALGWIFQKARSGPVRGLISDVMPTPRELNDAKMNLVISAAGSMLRLPPLLSAAAAPRSLGARSIIEAVARQEYAKGTQYLLTKLSANERNAYLADPVNGSRYIGTAVHKATAEALERLFPDRFEYFPNNGMDFLDKTTGEMIELTTGGQALIKVEKYNLSNGTQDLSEALDTVAIYP